MKDATNCCSRLTIWIVAFGIAGCGVETMPPEPTSSQASGPHDILRVRTDELRGRTWVLSLDDVRVYGRSDRRLIRRIALPPWSVAAELCMPDMVLDRSGSALIAGNAHPTLIRIDAASYRLTEHEIRLRGRETWAIGFGALGFASDGGLYGLTASGNSLWRIHAEKGVADMVEAYDPPLAHCAPTGVLGTAALTDVRGRDRPKGRHHDG